MRWTRLVERIEAELNDSLAVLANDTSIRSGEPFITNGHQVLRLGPILGAEGFGGRTVCQSVLSCGYPGHAQLPAEVDPGNWAGL